MSCYLYIIVEIETTKVWDGLKWNDKYSATQYSKIGITADQLWERLRKLNQGNPRILVIKHLWIGDYFTIKGIEQDEKDSREWLDISADELKARIMQHPNASKIHYVTYDDLLPYYEKNKSGCTITHVSPTAMHEACVLANGERFIITSDDKTIYLTGGDKWKEVKRHEAI